MRAAFFLTGSVLALSLTGLSPASAASTAAGTPSPAVLNTGASRTFTLSGPNAVADEQVVLKQVGHDDIPGTVTTSGPLCIKGVADQCGTSITVSVPVADAYPGSYDIVRTQTPAFGGSPTTLTTSPGITLKSAPAIASISPSTRGQNSSSLVTISGHGFGPDSVVDFGSDITVSDVAYVNGATLTANVLVPPTATLGTRDLTVTSADQLSDHKTGILTVAPKPTLTAISVPTILRGVETDGVVFTGTGLVTGGDFNITIVGVDVLNPVASNDGTTVTANLKALANTPTGNRTVQLTNADGGRANLVGQFRVIAPPSAPQAVTAIPGDTKVTVGWTPPSDPGSSPISSYVITPSDAAVAPVEVAGNKISTEITGLTNGTSYTFDVRAKNADGTGDKLTTQAVTPKLGTLLTAFSNRATAVSGQSAVIYGYLKRTAGTPMAGKPITLHIAQSGLAATTKELTTDANGRWAATVPLTYNATFLATYAGTSDTQGRNSSVYVPVGSRITVTSPASGATVGSPFTVRGTVSPNKTGKSVGIYKVTSAGQTLVAKATISSSGTYGASVRLPVGNYLLKVVLGPVSGNSTGTSPQFVVKRR